MYYISKKTPIKNIVHNKNFKYYVAILIIFICAIAGIIYAYKHADNKADNSAETEKPTTVEEESTTVAETVAENRYYIRVNLAKGFLTVYKTDADNKYDEPYKTMLCSVNSSIQEGKYTSDETSGKAIWSDLNKSYTRYYTALTDVLAFHSSLYTKKNDKNSLDTTNYALLGQRTDVTGITLLVADAKWIYENCSINTTTVEIYSDDKEKAALEYQELISIPTGISWEPTDVSEGTPWCTTKIDKMTGVKDLNIKTRSSLAVLTAGITALDKDGKDISQYIFITGKFNLNEDGKYEITYNLLDIYGTQLSQKATITVGTGITGETTSADEKATTIPEKPTDGKKPDKETTAADSSIPTKEEPIPEKETPTSEANKPTEQEQ